MEFFDRSEPGVSGALGLAFESAFFGLTVTSALSSISAPCFPPDVGVGSPLLLWSSSISAPSGLPGL
jgi:hypothetical protein